VPFGHRFYAPAEVRAITLANNAEFAARSAAFSRSNHTMIKRTAVTALLSVVVATFAIADESGRYVVALKRGALRAEPSALIRDVESAPRARRIASLSLINGFAADLTAAEAAAMKRSAGVRYVEPVVTRYALGRLSVRSDATTRNLLGQTTPFGLDMIRAREVWGVTRGETINVVVVDTGVDYKHPDLAPNWAGGYNVITKTNDPLDDHGHGTHVAGTIAAADNDFGVIGVAPNVRLWGVKVLNSAGSGTSDKVIAALDWITARKNEMGGRWVVNLSLGSKESSAAEEEAFGEAVAEGLLVVAAAGNESTTTIPAPVGYPAAYPGVIAVGAVSDNSLRASFSNQGPQVSVVAPGVSVLSSMRVGSGEIAGVSTATAQQFLATGVEGSKRGTVSGEFVFCGLGRTADFPSNVAGRIAVIQRGEITFAEKTRAAKAAGATAVVIVNNDDSAITWTLIAATDPLSATFDWPITIGVSKQDGARLLAARTQITVTLRPDDYGEMSGTSMATPHVAGVAALLWGAAPAATAADLRGAIGATASDLGDTGVDPEYGAGLIDALNAAKRLAPSRFGAPATPAPEPEPEPTRRRTTRR
jgi:serine protease